MCGREHSTCQLNPTPNKAPSALTWLAVGRSNPAHQPTNRNRLFGDVASFGPGPQLLSELAALLESNTREPYHIPK